MSDRRVLFIIMKHSNVITYRKKELVVLSTGKLQSKPQTDNVSGQTQNWAFLLFRSGLSVPVCIMSFSYISCQRNHLEF